MWVRLRRRRVPRFPRWARIIRSDAAAVPPRAIPLEVVGTLVRWIPHMLYLQHAGDRSENEETDCLPAAGGVAWQQQPHGGDAVQQLPLPTSFLANEAPGVARRCLGASDGAPPVAGNGHGHGFGHLAESVTVAPCWRGEDASPRAAIAPPSPRLMGARPSRASGSRTYPPRFEGGRSYGHGPGNTQRSAGLADSGVFR